MAPFVTAGTMIQRTSAGTERGIERGQALVETLVRRPVKEAVREALAEAEGQGTPSAAVSADQPAGESGRRRGPMLLLSLLGVAAAALYLRRRESDVLDVPSAGEQTADTGDMGEAVTTGPEMGGEGEAMSDEAISGAEERTDTDTEEDSSTAS